MSIQIPTQATTPEVEIRATYPDTTHNVYDVYVGGAWKMRDTLAACKEWLRKNGYKVIVKEAR